MNRILNYIAELFTNKEEVNNYDIRKIVLTQEQKDRYTKELESDTWKKYQKYI